MHGEGSQSADPIAHVFKAWDAALGAKDLDASMALYHPDATLESPLVRHLRGTDEGIVRGVRACARSWPRYSLASRLSDSASAWDS